MIKEFFGLSDASKITDLERLDDLVKSQQFLCGLAGNVSELGVFSRLGPIRNVSSAFEMMTSQEVWDLPEPWPYQYFPGIIEDELGRLQYENGLDIEERLTLSKVYTDGVDDVGVYLFEKIDSAYNRHGIKSFLMDGRPEQSKNSNFEWVISNGLRNEIQGYLQGILEAICFGGLAKTPFFQRMYEAFLTGGLPCGWLGPRPEDGGDPANCLRLLHLGVLSE